MIDWLISEDWILLKNTIREKAENLDENLISILLDNDTTREKFFIKIKDVIVFDKKVFTNFKRIDKDWEHKLEGFNRDEKWDIKDNLIINSFEVIQSNFLNNSKHGIFKSYCRWAKNRVICKIRI